MQFYQPMVIKYQILPEGMSSVYEILVIHTNQCVSSQRLVADKMQSNGCSSEGAFVPDDASQIERLKNVQ